MKDLFGNEMILPPKTGKPGTVPQVNARMRSAWGTIPEQRCKNCINFVRKQMSKTYFKCGLAGDTNGAATDIKANDLACGKFAPAEK